MKEFSDTTNRTIIIILFFFFYLYVKYIQTQLKLRKNRGEISCNPLEMVIGGFINEEEANKTFESCMNYTTAKNVTKYQDKMNTKFTGDIQDVLDEIKSNNDTDTQNRSKNQESLIKLLNMKADNIDQLVSNQTKINETLKNSYTPFKNILEEIGNVTNTAKDVFIGINNRFSSSD